MSYTDSIQKYSKKIIELINPTESGLEVLQNENLLLHIFGFFKSGWIVHYKSMLYYDKYYKYYGTYYYLG